MPLIVGHYASTVHAQPVWQTSATAVGTAASATVAKPTGTVAGDLLIVGIMLEKGSDVAITATGWTLILRTNQSTNVGMATYWKLAGGSEPASYSFPLTNGPKWAIGMSRITGADTTTPIDNSGAQTGASGNVTAPTINTTVANTLVLAFYTNKKNATYTAAGTTTERYDVPNDPGGLPSNMMATFTQASAGATGNKVATPSDTDSWVGQQVAVRPAVSSATPGSFNAFETSTAAGAITGVIKTRIAGTAFSLDAVAIASGAQLAGFTAAVTVELLGNNTLGVALDAQNCPTSFTLVQTVAPDPTITGGRSTVSFAAVANSWRDVRVRVRWPTTSPTVTSCSTDNFAIRPNTLASFAVSDADWQTAGTGRALTDVTFGTVTHKAGRPLSVRATSLNAAGAPATTTNYAGAPSATLSACAGAACTATFGTLTLNATFGAGLLVTDVASYDNVGSFRLQLVDSAFASVDASDGSTPAERDIASAALDVGRFVPDHFAVTYNTPRFGTSCGTFIYQGQRFIYTTAPVITVTAQDFANNTTTLYAGTWWRITNTSLTPNTQAARYSAAGSVALDVGALPGTNSDPVIAISGNGVGTLTFSSTGGIAFNRTTPVAPFDADIALSIDAIDADDVAFAGNPAKFGDATAGNGIAFSAGKQMRFGRLRVQNAYGPETVGLQVPLETQYWNTLGTAFVRSADDSCTTLNREHITLSAYTQNLNACETAVNQAMIAFSSGLGTLTLAAAGSGNSGTVLLTPNLAAAGGMYCPTRGGTETAAVTANRAYLQGKWTGANWDENPAARATFGLYGSQPNNFIFFRENY